MTLIETILEFVFGRKYYMNIFHRIGTNAVSASSLFFGTKEEAINHREKNETNITYRFVETVSFRSRNLYVPGDTGESKFIVKE